MARRWTIQEENIYRKELFDLYVVQNKSITEIAPNLGISYKTVYDRLRRLSIPTNRKNKPGYNNMLRHINIPNVRSPKLAEFFGIMLGDGSLTPTQVAVTLGTKEPEYTKYVAKLMCDLFEVNPRILVYGNEHRTVYFGSVVAVRWLQSEGLVMNKVAAQVGVPTWIFEKDEYMERFVRGFFDTDGSIYKLRFGIQISLTNHSLPLLEALHEMLSRLQYYPSSISAWRIYVTRRREVQRFFRQVNPQNMKHQRRLDKFMRQSDSGYSTRL